MKVMTQSLAMAAASTAIFLATSTVEGGAELCVLSASAGMTTNCKDMADLTNKAGAASLYCPTKADCISVFGSGSGSSTSEQVVERSAGNQQVAGIEEAETESSALKLAVGASTAAAVAVSAVLLL